MFKLKLLIFSIFISAILLNPASSYQADKSPIDKAAVLGKVAKLQIPFIENQGQVKDKSVRFYANTFAGNVYVTEKGEVVYSLLSEAKIQKSKFKNQNLGGDQVNTLATVKKKTRDLRHETKGPVGADSRGEPVARPISGQLGLDIVPASFINGQETKDTRPEIKNTIGAGSVPARSLNVGQGLSLAKESNPEGLPYKGIALRESLIGAKEMNIKGEDKAKTQVNYFVGDKKNWKSNIPAWDAVNFGEVYNGITFKLKAYGKNVEKLFIVNPGGNSEDIRIKVEGVKVESTPSPHEREKTSKVPFPMGGENYQQPPSPLEGEGRGEGDSRSRGIKINDKGELELNTELGSIKFTKPYAYQEIDGKRVEVAVVYRIQKTEGRIQNPPESPFVKGGLNSIPHLAKGGKGGFDSQFPTPNSQLTYGFTVASYNPNYSLIIDPLLASTFIGGIGGSGNDYGGSIAIDTSGDVFVTGYTASPKFPTTRNAYSTYSDGYGGFDVFISKLNNKLTSLLSSTIVGGEHDDYGNSLAIDSHGNVFITGETTSSNYPTTSGAFDTSYNGGDVYYKQGDAFITKLNNTLSSILVSTFIGGSGWDKGTSIAIDTSGNVFATGYTNSPNFPTTKKAYDISHTDGVFVSKLNNKLSSLLSSTYLGKGYGNSIAIDLQGNVFVTGEATSSSYPTTPGAYDTSFNEGDYYGRGNVFISKLDNKLSVLLASTLIGGNSYNSGSSIAIDNNGNIFITGKTSARKYPTTPGAYDTSFNKGVDLYNYMDAFVSKFDNDLSTLLASTFIGGRSDDYVNSIAIDSSGNVFVTGMTASNDYPTTPGAYDTSFNGGADVFISKLDNNLSTLLFSTLIGGYFWDSGSAIAIDHGSNIFVTGGTMSYDYPTTQGAYDTSYNGGCDGFVTKFDSSLIFILSSTFLGGTGGRGYDLGNSIVADSSGNIFVTGTTSSPDYPASLKAYDKSYNGVGYYSGNVFVSKFDSNLSSLLSSTFIGGSGEAEGNSIAIDSSGNIFVAGVTDIFVAGVTIYSSDFPTTPDAYDTSFNGAIDAFVLKLNNNLSSLLSSTFLGGYYYDYGNSIGIDSSDNIFVAGETASYDYPATPGAYSTDKFSYESSVFVSKLNNNLSSLLSSTFVGENIEDSAGANSIAIDSGDNIFVTGYTYGNDYPTTPGAYVTQNNYYRNVIISKLNNKLSSLLASSVIGGSSDETGNSIVIDSEGNVYVAGETESSDYPTTSNAYDTKHIGIGASDVFVSKLNNDLSALLSSTFVGGGYSGSDKSIVVDSAGNIFVTGRTGLFYPTGAGYDLSKNYSDVFVKKLNNDLGSLLSSAFISGSGTEIGNSIIIDTKDNIFITGGTSSFDFPTSSGFFDTSHNNIGYDVFVLKLDNNLSTGVFTPTPDLSPKIIKLPKVIKQGRILHIRATGKNIGNADASSFNVGFYLSSNNNKSIDGDTLLGEETLSGLVKNKAKKVIYKWNVPKDFLKGNYYIKVFWDNENSIAESNEDNNIGVSSKIEVRENQSHPQGRVFPRFF